MKELTSFIIESLVDFILINEQNMQVFPKPGKFAKLSWWKGDHAAQRQKERSVTDTEITDAIFSAYNDIKKLFADGKIRQSRDGKDSYIVIIDARKNKVNPTCICLYIRSNRSSKKLDRPSFTIKTVFKKTEENQKDFSALLRNGSKREGENIIYLY